MTIFFRLDVSSRIGNGHFVRCLTLAKALMKQQIRIVFICADISDILSQQIVSEGIILEKIETLKDELIDAENVTRVLNNYCKGLIIIDHYELNISWHKIISRSVHKIIVLDDMANRNIFCHLLINSGCFNKEAYKSLIPDSCELILGPEFVILRPEYLYYKKNTFKEQINRVLVFMGGADSKNVTSKIIEAFSDSRFDAIKFDIVVGSNNSKLNHLEKIVETRSNFIIYQNRPHLADLMQQSDFAFGAGGSSAWERICIGLPSAIITLSENQIFLTKKLHNFNLVNYLGHFDQVTVEDIRQFLINEISAGNVRKKYTKANKLCDGLGVDRIVKKILSITP
jgi:UDP-2,4-diacetamido-2,4,6-trideoxy-beta-L-altropyranose hydrolase